MRVHKQLANFECNVVDTQATSLNQRLLSELTLSSGVGWSGDRIDSVVSEQRGISVCKGTPRFGTFVGQQNLVKICTISPTTIQKLQRQASDLQNS